ncbi:MAG: UPF0149 family protein [Methylococcaceae bacterium]|nr:UPF0149 family protein [Methylococcaceae bacterium]
MAYQALSSIFQRYDSDLTPAEAHGIATAMLCVNRQCESANWFSEVFEDVHSVIEDDRSVLVDLFEQTRKLLDPDESVFEFDLFLPQDADLAQQAASLANWSKGFLWGIGYSRSKGDWQGETDGILRDMVEFTKLDIEVEDDDDEDEDAFIQIHEYLRAAVLIVRDELNQHSDSSH